MKSTIAWAIIILEAVWIAVTGATKPPKDTPKPRMIADPANETWVVDPEERGK